jgi:lambda family phage tail tape measure protein
MNDQVQLELELSQNGVAQALANIQKALDGLVKSADSTSAAINTTAKTATSSLNQVAEGADKASHATAGVTREFIVLGRELVTGNFARLPGSMLVLANRTGILGNLLGGLSGTGLAVAGALGLIAGAAAAVGVAFYQAAEQEKAFQASLVNTNNYAGLTSDSFHKLADSIAASSSYSVAKTREAAQALLSTGQFNTKAQVEALTPVILKESTLQVKSVEDVAKEFAKLAQSPAKVAEEMNSSMHIFTPAIQEQIKTLQEEGRTQDAANVAIQAFTKHLADNSVEVEKQIGFFGRLTRSVSDMWTAFKQGVGAEELGDTKQLDALQKKINEMKKSGDKGGAPIFVEGVDTGAHEATLDELEAQFKVIMDKMAGDAKKAQADAADALKSAQFQEASGYFEGLAIKGAESLKIALAKFDEEVRKLQESNPDSKFNNAAFLATARQKIIEENIDPEIERKQRQSFQDSLSALDESAKEYANGVKVKNALVKVELEKGNIDQKTADEELHQIQLDELAFQESIIKKKLAFANSEVSRTNTKNGTAERRKALEELKAINSEEQVVDANYAAEKAKAAREIQDIEERLNVTLERQTAARAKQAEEQLNKVGLSNREADLENALLTIREQATVQIEKETAALKKLNASEEDITGVIQKIRDAEATALAQEKVYWQQKTDAEDNWMLASQKALKNYVDSATSAGQAAKSLIDATNKGIEDTLYNAMVKGKLSMQTLETSIIDSIDRIVAKALTANIDQLLFGGMAGGSGGGTGLIGMLGSLFGGARAQGGPVQPGQIYSVNENTPNSEYFVPTTPGMIVPAGGIQSSPGNSTNVTIHAVDAPSFRQLLSRDPRFLTELVNNTAHQYGM